ncbi:MAG TPA: hypothetical protein VKA75_04610, partial [Reyranella sp.]|nr:hypothetical protein [Reyranella sp.]
AWSMQSARRNPAVMLDQAALPWFAELNRSLADQLDDAAFQLRMRASAAQLQLLAAEIQQRAEAEHPGLDGGGLHAVLAGRPGIAPAAMAASPMLFAPA